MPGPFDALNGLRASMPKTWKPPYDPATDPSAVPQQYAASEQPDLLSSQHFTPGQMAAQHAFEGTTEFSKGLVGFGSGHGANGVGQLVAAAVPLAGSSGIPGLYSRLEQAVGRMSGSMKANSALNALRKFAHPEEIEATGVGGMLRGLGEQKVPAADIAGQATGNRIKLETETLGEPAPNPIVSHGLELHGDTAIRKYGTADYVPKPTTYDTYQMPGHVPGSYRETLIKTPVSPDQDALNYWKTHDFMEEYGPTFSPESARGPGEPRDIPPVFTDPHWPEHPNVLAHVRHNERMLPGPLPEGFKVQTGTDFQSNSDYPVHWVEGRQPDPTNTIRGWNHYMGPSGKTPEEATRLAMEKDLGSKGRVLENVQSDWHQQGAKGGYGQKYTQADIDAAQSAYAQAEQARLDYVLQNQDVIGSSPGDYPELDELWANRNLTEGRLNEVLHHNNPGVPDAPFKDNRWADLALKQQLYDTASNPELEWLGIAPGSESMRRGESLSPQFHDEVLPRRLGKLMAPHGGTMEQVSLGIPKNKFGAMGGSEVANISDPAAMGVASVWPKYNAFENTRLNFNSPHTSRADDLATLIENQPHNQLQMWLSRFTPEVRASILKNGFSLMALYAMMHGGAGQAPPEGALTGLKAAAPQ